MKKKTVSLAVLILCLLLLCGAYFLVLRAGGEGEGAADTTEASDASYTVLSLDVESMRALSYLSSDGELAFTLVDNAWHWTENEKLPLDSARFAAMVSGLQPLTSTVKIDAPNAEKLAEFGLDVPTNRVTLTDASGTHTLLIGAYNRYNGLYYAALDTTDTVYMIGASVADALRLPIADLIAHDTLPTITAGKIDSVSLSVGGTTQKYVCAAAEDGSDGRAWYAEQADGQKIALDDTLNGDLTVALSSLSFGDCLSRDAEADAAKYGLDTPATLTVGYRTDVKGTDMSGNETTTEVKHSVSILVGHVDAESGCYYATLEGSPLIYLLDSPVFPKLFSGLAG